MAADATPASAPANGSARGSNGITNHASNAPISMRRAPRLDLKSVERRGQPLAARETNRRVRPHGLTEAPTFRPSEEEFRDPMEYIRKIGPEASKYGICKIIPPSSWNPPFAIDTERFHFRTRRQELNSVEGSTRTNLNYLDQLAKFHKQHGMNLNRFPSVDKRPLDLYKLKKAVETRGGFDRVCKLKKWAEIGRDLGYSGKIMSSLSTSLKNSYQKWLSPYEDYLRVAKPGVQQQRELENGGPFTPSPVPSPGNPCPSNKGTPASNIADSSAMRASTALQQAVRESDEADKPASSGFAAVNAGGFTAVNAAGSKTNGVLKKETDGSTPHPQQVASSNDTPDRPGSPMLGVSPIPNGTDDLKRTVSRESANGVSSNESATNGDSETPNGRRSSKRQKRDGAPTVAGSHMTALRPLVPKALGPKPGMSRAKDTKPGERCEGCGQPESPSELTICDSCDNGYHRDCVDPPIKATSDWNCPRCLVGTGEFGFEEGGTYSLKQFQEKATNFKESYFAAKMPFDPVSNRKRIVSEDDVEREFWRLVESITETVEVEYGADIHSTTHGSGFPECESAPTDPYSTNPWNLNVLPLHQDSLFRHIKSDISGMTVPWLYVGMCFSTFCWHNEDHYTYSANYQHFGATKTWYGIPGRDAEKFEHAMREAVPELFEQQPDLLFQLVTLLPPDQLRRAGVEVYALDQRAGQFVITFPQAYHAGFNHGFNFNEAVNFAPADWEPFGQGGVKRLQEFRRQPCFSHDELLMTAAARDTTIKAAKWLAPALSRLQEVELTQRKDFLTRHLQYGQHHCKLEDGAAENCQIGFEKDDSDLPEEEYQCFLCKSFTFLSRYQCPSSGRVLCLQHAGTFECCDASIEQRHLNADHVVRYRLSDEDLRAQVTKIVDRSRAPDLWQEKLDKVLENDPRPPLKTLRSLVSEGERIPYDVPGLADLKAFVERCSEWLEEATNYIVRKQQNRRKNERAWRRTSKTNGDDEREQNARRLQNMYNLVKETDSLAFDDPVIATLRERADEITKFRQDSSTVLQNPTISPRQDIEELIEVGKGFNVDVPEVEQLEAIVKQLKWSDRADELRSAPHNLADVEDLLKDGATLSIADSHPQKVFWNDMRSRGNFWEAKAKELISAETIHYHQLEALANQASTVPVSTETRAKIDGILSKQREAHRRIISLCETSKDPDFEKRPKYRDVRELLDSLQDLNSKPAGTMDLEKEAKRHEDWMRRGKKLFGKANAPLHILLQHMTLVRDRNEHCLSLEDKPRMPVEPASRDQTPVDDQKSDAVDVFCICRQSEGGMMIECELCHEWYHGKCLKIARGKIKVEDKYTCPICDWRVKIPRDAARPKLEDLQDWQAEIPTLPFQPEEDQVLDDIVTTGQDFRDALRTQCSPVISTPDEIGSQRFYLRKIEGADILLSFETNFFRQELHKWVPVAPEPPPILEHSLSTRKPRPTKQQKLMAQLGIENPEDLPVQLRTKAHVFKTRKASNSEFAKAVPLQPAPLTKGSNSKHSPSGNTPSTPTFSPSLLHGPPQTANPSELASSSQAYAWQHRISGGPQSPMLPQSPIFRPTTPNSAERAARAQLDPSLFSPSNASFAVAALRETAGTPATITLAGPMPETFGPSLTVGTPGGASATSGSNMDRLFAEYTTDGDKERNEAGEALESLEVDQISSPHMQDSSEHAFKDDTFKEED